MSNCQDDCDRFTLKDYVLPNQRFLVRLAIPGMDFLFWNRT